MSNQAPDDWRVIADQNRRKFEAAEAAAPKLTGFTRDQLIETAVREGITSANFGGDGHIEGGAFFRRLSTNDLRSILEDYKVLYVLEGSDPVAEMTDLAERIEELGDTGFQP